MSGAGRGYAVAQTPGGAQVFGSWLDHDHFQLGGRLDSIDGSARAKPEIASTDRNDNAIAWRLTGLDGNSVARARYRDGDTPSSAFGGEVTVSRPDLGPVADPGVFIGGDRVGDFAVAMVQGNAGRAGAGRRGLRPPAGRAVHRVLAGLQAQDAARSCAGGPASSCGARRPIASTWTVC